MATAPVVNGQTLPYAQQDRYTEEVFYKGTVKRMASGALVRELMTASRKLRFKLEWVALSATQKGYIDTALGYLEDGTSRSFTSPRNQNYTVVLAEGGEPEWKIRANLATGAFLYSGTLILEEV